MPLYGLLILQSVANPFSTANVCDWGKAEISASSAYFCF
jgi:hypothetical protein